MPKYRLTVQAEALIEEAWEVDAWDADDAERRMRAGDATFIEQSDPHSESNRDVLNIEEV